jgi:hypothetical protein
MSITGMAFANISTGLVPVSNTQLREVSLQSVQHWERALFPRILRVFPSGPNEATVVYENEAKELLLCYIKNGAVRDLPALDASGSTLTVSPLSPFSIYGYPDRVSVGTAQWKRGKPVDASAVQFLEYSDGALTSSHFLHLPKPGFTTHGLIPVAASRCGNEKLALLLQYSERHFDLSKIPEAPYSYFSKYCSLWYGEQPGEYQPVVKPGAFKTSRLAFVCSPDGSLHAAWVEERRRSARIMYSTNKFGTGWCSPEIVVSTKGAGRLQASRLFLSATMRHIDIIWGMAGKGTFLCSRNSKGFSEPEVLDDSLQPLQVHKGDNGGLSVVLEGRNRIALLRSGKSGHFEKHELMTPSSCTPVRRPDAQFDQSGNVHIVYFLMSTKGAGHYQYTCFSAGTSINAANTTGENVPLK